jgi:hypothetical protein
MPAIMIGQRTVLRTIFIGKLTLVETVLVLLALGSAASGAVELVADSAEEAALALLLRAGGLGLVLAGVGVVAATSEVLDEVHCG